MDWSIIWANLAAGLTLIMVLVRLVRRDRRDQKLIKTINGLAEDFARCTYRTETAAPAQEADPIGHRTGD